MKKEKQTISELLSAFEDHLISLKRSRVTIRLYKYIWGAFKEYARSHHTKFYNRLVGDQFIKSQ
jgi:hypothetical protein